MSAVNVKNGGCWIFLSHSSHDIEKVRMIRNEFEKYGQNPLAFHLKCLTTDTESGKQELDNLIKREIDAREWFVFCDSDSARLSEYVQMEMNYIINNNKKNIWSIDMSKPISEIRKTVEDICTKMKVFISFYSSERPIADTLRKELIKRDFEVWEPAVSDTNWKKPFRSAIKDAAKYGFFISLITKHYSESKIMEWEVMQAMSNGALIIPLVCGDAEIPKYLQHIQCYKLPCVPRESDIHLVVELIEAILRLNIVGPLGKAEAYTAVSRINETLNTENRFHTEEAVLKCVEGEGLNRLEIYEFPCCGAQIKVGCGPVLRHRSDGCSK